MVLVFLITIALKCLVTASNMWTAVLNILSYHNFIFLMYLFILPWELYCFSYPGIFSGIYKNTGKLIPNPNQVSKFRKYFMAGNKMSQSNTPPNFRYAFALGMNVTLGRLLSRTSIAMFDCPISFH